MAKYPSSLLSLIHFLKALPGVGTKTAERFAFHLLDSPGDFVKQFGRHLAHFQESIQRCTACGCLIETAACPYCQDPTREKGYLCIIGSPKEVYFLEETKIYRGHYHVLETLLSPLDGKGPDQINLDRLRQRIESLSVQEVIMALDATIEGDATALFIRQACQEWNVRTSRLAFGLPLGSSLEGVDEGTLMRALQGRQTF